MLPLPLLEMDFYKVTPEIINKKEKRSNNF